MKFIIAAPLVEMRPQESQKPSLHCRHPNARNHALPNRNNCVVSLGDSAEPFDCEVLDAEDEVAECAAFDLDFVRGECEVQRFGSSSTGGKAGGDEMRVWEEMNFSVDQFDAEAGGWGFALPADWRGDGW